MSLRCILVLGCILAFNAFGASRTNLSNGVMAIVNETVITYKDMEYELRNVAQLLESQYGNRPDILDQKLQQAEREILEQLITQQLILQEFKTKGYNLPETYIEDSIKRDIREQYGDRLKLTKTLQANGDTYENYRKRTRDRIIVQSLTYKNINGELLISPQKVERYFNENKDKFKLEDQVKLRMIVLNVKADRDEAQTKKLAVEILTKLKEGANFPEMATIYSDGSQRNQGGDWGWVEKSVLRKELAEVAFVLKPGSVSDVITTDGAIYLMRVEETKVAGYKQITDVRDVIEKTLIGEERARLQKKWLDRLRSKSFVRYF